jgi:hypothetical protein
LMSKISFLHLPHGDSASSGKYRQRVVHWL